MDTQTLNRNKGDLNSSSFHFLTNKSSKQQFSISSNTEKTQSLSIVSNNHVQLVQKDFLALDGQIDKNLFNDEFRFQFILSERKEFESIDQIENQRLLIQCCQNRSIFIGMLLDTYQLVVIKEMLFYQEEELIKMLDEFKIQNKLNNLFPQQTLLLFKPVKVEKLRQFYGLKAVMEKAETNLFIYSQKNKTTANQAYTIFRIILKQLINMHSIKIAHRDVKPQNIFYVIDKGWLLSDFGESQEYEELEQFYNIRGTLYFLMPQIQTQVNRGKQINQNLLVNDLYALVVTIIIILKIQNIDNINVTQEINNLNDQYLIQTLKIKTYQQLIEFEQKLNEVNEKIIYNNQNIYNKHLSLKEESYNQTLNYQSWIQLCYIYLQRQIFPNITNQIIKLINNNFGKICSNLSYESGQLLSNLYITRKIINFDPIDFQIHISRMTMEQIELVLTLMFVFGYSETTLKYCEQILAKQYNQFIHLKLIDCLERLMMFDEAVQQFEKFKQGLIFDQLNNANQQQFMLKLKYYKNDQSIDLDCNLQELLIHKRVDQVYAASFENDIKQYDQLERNNTEIIVELVKTYLQEYSSIYNVFCNNYVSEVLYMIQFYNINIQSQLHMMIFNQRLGSLDSSRRIAILFDLGQTFYLQQNCVKFNYTIKMIQRELFKAESWQQQIIFKIQILILKLNNAQSQNNRNDILDRLYLQIQKIYKVGYNLFIVLIQEYLKYFLGIISNYKCLRSKEIKMVIQTINFISENKYYKKSFQMFQYYHILVQNLLIKNQNHRRCLKLIHDYQDKLSNNSLNFFQNQMKFKQVAFSTFYYEEPLKYQQSQFLFFQFLQL